MCLISVSAGTAARFKESAYKLVRDVTLAHDFEPHPQQPAVRVVLAYRCRQASESPLSGIINHATYMTWLTHEQCRSHHYQRTLSSSPSIHSLVTLYQHPGRRMTNVELMKRIMTASLPPPRYDLHFNCTSSHYLSAVDQIKMVALAHVVIAEHGAFQSNMMYVTIFPTIKYKLFDASKYNITPLLSVI